MLDSGGIIDFDILECVINHLRIYSDFIFNWMADNGKTTTDVKDDDWEIPNTGVKSLVSTGLQVMTSIKKLMFLTAQAQYSKLLLPVPAAAAAPAGDRADGAAELPHAALRPRPVPVPMYDNAANEELVMFGREFRANASA